MEALDPSRAEISKFKISTRKKNDSVTPFVFFHFIISLSFSHSCVLSFLLV